MMVLFFERGMVSNQFYQPAMNHRSVDPSHYYSERVVNGDVIPPLSDSMMFPTAVNDFTAQTPISLFAHEIGVPETDEVVQDICLYHSNCKMKARYDRLGLSEADITARGELFAEGILRDRVARPLSGKTFKRLLEFFGFEWKLHAEGTVSVDDLPNDSANNEDDPSLAHQKAFWKKLENIYLSTRMGFKKFLTDFRFDKIFMYKEGKPVWTEAMRFGALARALVPFRFGTPEGNHRTNMFGYYLTGYFEPDNTAPLKKVSWADFTGLETKEQRTARWKQLQLWQNHKIALMDPDPCEGRLEFHKALEKLKLMGETQTTGAELHIGTSFATMMEKLCNEVEKKKLDEDDPVIAPTFENSFKAGQLSKRCCSAQMNLITITAVLASQIHAKPDFKRYVQKDGFVTDQTGSRKVVWEDHSEASLKASEGMNLVVKAVNYSSGEIPRNFAVVCELMRLAAVSSSAPSDLCRFFASPTPSIKQVPDITKSLSHFRTLQWARYHIFPMYFNVAKRIEERLLIEQALVKAMRNQNRPDLKERLSVGDLSRPLNPEVLDLDDSPKQVDGETVEMVKGIHAGDGAEHLTKIRSSKSAIGLESLKLKSSWIHAVMIFSLRTGVLLDIVQTINEFGFSPGFDPSAPDDTNVYLRNYLT